MTTKRDCRNCGGDGYTTELPRCPACDGEGKVAMPTTADEWFESHKDDVEAPPETKMLIAIIFEFAQREGKLEQLVTTLDRACFPTFFGEPAVTVLSRDFAQHSLYFEVYPRRVAARDRRGQFLMNGGIIYHQTAGDWSVHT
jgi:hypothetical protein